jgi:hypothetical protein
MLNERNAGADHSEQMKHFHVTQSRQLMHVNDHGQHGTFFFLLPIMTAVCQ